MSLSVSASDGALELPPVYDLIVLREAGDAFVHACAVAEEQGAGTLVWVRRHDLAEFAVVLEPDEPLAGARRAVYAGMNAVADALAAYAPPEWPIFFVWPDTIQVDGVTVGGYRLGWPAQVAENEVPDWLVLSVMIRTSVIHGSDPGLRPFSGGLDELGFEPIDASDIVESFSRHLMAGFHEWSQIGFASVEARWLARFAAGDGRHARLDDNGDLLISAVPGQPPSERRSLVPALASPSWLDPATGMPWL